jgi:hypothetical protein
MPKRESPPGTRRFTIDVPLDLHRHIKMSCAARDKKMSDELRRVLREAFQFDTPDNPVGAEKKDAVTT